MSSKFNLDIRQKHILYFIIRAYGSEGVPVGSRLISKRLSEEHLSPATIRNVMSDLEEMGLLQQPHVSAGRVPTDTAYRMLVEDLISSRSFSFDKRNMLKIQLEKHDDNFQDFFKFLSELIYDYTGHIGLVLTPMVDQIKCKNIRFVKINDSRVLAVFVSNKGIIHNKLIEITEPINQDELDRISNIVRENFRGLTVSRIIRKIHELLREERVRYNKLLERALNLSKLSFGMMDIDDTSIYYSGAEKTIDKISKEQYKKMINLYKTFEDKTRLLVLLEQCLKGDDLNVIIGAENSYSEFEDLSLISASYSSQGRVLGTMAVLGPKWMNYDSTLGFIYYGTRLVSNILTENRF